MPLTRREFIGQSAVAGASLALAACRAGAPVRATPAVSRISRSWISITKGYLLLDLDRERARSERYFVDTIERRSAGQRLARAFETPRGSAILRSVS